MGPQGWVELAETPRVGSHLRGDLRAVLLNGGHGGAMAELRCDFLKKRHRIAVAWRVKDGGAMAAMADVAARRKMADAAATLDLEAPTQRDNPRPGSDED